MSNDQGKVPNKMDRQSFLVAIAKDACDCAAKQYDNLDKTFSALDTKAQSSATIGGVVIASGIAFSKELRDGAATLVPSSYQPFLFLIPAVCSLAAMIAAFLASKVSEVVVPFSAQEQIQEVEDLSHLPPEELSEGHLLSYYRARLEVWKTALTSIDTAISKKANRVLFAQISLLVSFGTLLIMFISVIPRKPKTPSDSPQLPTPQCCCSSAQK